MSRNDFLDKIKKPFGNPKQAEVAAAGGTIDKPLTIKNTGGKATKTKNVTRVASKASGARGGGGAAAARAN